MRLTTDQMDRACGVLLGQACGDALGVPYELAASPAAGEAMMKGGGLGNYAPGEWSDDTQMAACIAAVTATGADLTGPAALDKVADGSFVGAPRVRQTSASKRAACFGLPARAGRDPALGSPPRHVNTWLATRVAPAMAR